jgi:hypothetical protein
VADLALAETDALHLAVDAVSGEFCPGFDGWLPDWMAVCHRRDDLASAFVVLAEAGGVPARLSLVEFWPERGPVWDALATTSSGALLFVEAKAHVRELVSPPSKATPDSLNRIEQALLETRKFLAPGSRTDWSCSFYQYANRLAFLYFLRIKNDVNAHLIFVNFLGASDVDGPTSPEAWSAAYTILHAALGLPERHPLLFSVHHVEIDVAKLPPVSA